jgi:hypothetical protein
MFFEVIVISSSATLCYCWYDCYAIKPYLLPVPAYLNALNILILVLRLCMYKSLILCPGINACSSLSMSSLLHPTTKVFYSAPPRTRYLQANSLGPLQFCLQIILTGETITVPRLTSFPHTRVDKPADCSPQSVSLPAYVAECSEVMLLKHVCHWWTVCICSAVLNKHSLSFHGCGILCFWSFKYEVSHEILQ